MKQKQTWMTIANRLGVNHGTISRLRRREDWPPDVSPVNAAVVGPEQIEILRRWRSTLQEDRAAPLRMPDGAQARVAVRYKLEQTLWTRVKREILEGKYVERGLHEAALVNVTETFVSKLDDMQQALPLELDGLSAGEAEQRIGARFDEARQAIYERRDIELGTPHRVDPDAGPRDGRPPASGQPARRRSREPSAFRVEGKPVSRLARTTRASQ